MEHECKGNGSYNKGSRLAACICNEFNTIEVCQYYLDKLIAENYLHDRFNIKVDEIFNTDFKVTIKRLTNNDADEFVAVTRDNIKIMLQ